MRFPTKFSHYVGSPSGEVTVALPATFTPPTTAPSKNEARQVSSRPYNAQGWPGTRTVIGYKYEGIGTAPDVSADLYFWEDSIGSWFKLNASTLTLKNGIFTWSDLASVLEPSVTRKSLDDGTYSVGAIELCLDVKVAALSQVNGLYHFTYGVDISSS